MVQSKDAISVPESFPIILKTYAKGDLLSNILLKQNILIFDNFIRYDSYTTI